MGDMMLEDFDDDEIPSSPTDHVRPTTHVRFSDCESFGLFDNVTCYTNIMRINCSCLKVFSCGSYGG
jgi:hypothetical protein